ncbi:MAG TPA: xanthine dehydrogenase family protein subunit M [Nocardioidaceae bacterium]|nr:xanthine dehydrogenase family protein subunit M [Nocardioidaceae bacterium]
MKPAPFEYVRPRTADEAVAALTEAADAKVLAGGQSLIPLLSMRLAAPTTLVDLNGVDELAYVRTDDDCVRIGAMARHAQVEHDAAATARQPLLRQALTLVAHPTIRNRGTTVGSIAHADPAAELPAVLAVLGGTLTCRSASGTREITASECFVGPLESALRPDELATEIRLPALGPTSGTAIREVARRHGDYALVGVAAVVDVDGDDDGVASARAGYFSVADTPVVLDLTDTVDAGPSWDRAAEHAMAALDPLGDIHASADYRRHLIGVLTRQALAAAHSDARGTDG